MNTMNTILVLATILNGLLAGVFFTWTNAITPGIGKLSDINYLRAFQAMNRSILNPLFYVVFFGSIALSPLAAIYQYFESINYIFWMIIGVIIIYGIGVIYVTFQGNIPLNNRLDKIDLSDANLQEAKQFRNSYEKRWNYLHLIRTATSTGTFIVLILICLLNK